MMYLLDTAALNTIVLFIKRNNIIGARQRRILLEKLACGLIRTCAQERIHMTSLTGFSGFQTSLFTSFDRLGFNIKRISQPINSNKEMKLRRCCSKECKLKNNNNKYRNICNECGFHYCIEHCEKITTILCKECVNN